MTKSTKPVRSTKAARVIVMAAVGAPSDDAFSAVFLVFHFTQARTKQVIEATRFRAKQSRARSPQRQRLASLSHDLGQAAMALTRQRGPTRDTRIKTLRQIATLAASLHRLMTGRTEGRHIWSESQWVTMDTQRRVTSMLGQKVSTRFGGLLSRTFFPDTVRIIEELANNAIARAEANRGRGQYDPIVMRHPGSSVDREMYPEAADITEYVGRLAVAYYNYFGVEPGISTDARARRSGPFIRFVQAASQQINVTLTPDQIRSRFRGWKGRFRSA